MLSKKKLRFIIVLPILLFLLFAAAVLLASSLIQKPSVQQFLLAELSKATGYELRTGEIKISFWRGIGLSADNFEARSRSGAESIVASKVRVTLDAGELLNKRIVPTKIFLLEPEIDLALKKDWSSAGKAGDSVVRQIFSENLAKIAFISMKKARISIRDFPFALDDVHSDVFQKNGETQSFVVNIRGNVKFKEEEVPFTIKGTVTRGSNENGDLYFEMNLKTGNVPLKWIPCPDSVPVKGGHAQAHINIKGTLDGPVSTEGKIMIGDLRFLVIDDGIAKEFTQPRLALDFESSYSNNTLKIPSFRIKAPDFSLEGNSGFDLSDISNPGLTLRVKGPFMPLAIFKSIFPTPLLPTWIEDRLFPIVTGGNVRVDLFSLNGTFNQIENMDLPVNAGVLAMQLTWDKLNVFKDAGGLPFNRVLGKLDIKNGALLVSGVNGKFGQSFVKDGSLDIKSLFADNIIYDIRLSGSFDIEELLRQRGINLIPVKIRQDLNRLEYASGHLESVVQLRFEDGWDYPQIQKGDFRFKDSTIKQEELLFPLALDEAEIRIDRQGKSLFRGKGMWGKSEFTATGSLGKTLKTGRAEITGRAEMNEILNRSFRQNSLPITFSDLAKCQFFVSRTNGVWSCQGMIDLEGVLMETPSFSMDPLGTDDKIIFTLDIHPGEKINVKNIECYLGKSALSLTGSYDLKEGDSFNFSVSTERLVLEDLGVRFNKIDVSPQGILMCNAEINGSFRDPLKTTVNGEIEGQDISFVLVPFPSPIRDGSFKLKLSGKTASILFLNMLVGESPIHMKGDLRGWDGLKGEVTVKSNYLKASDFIPKGAGFRLSEKREGQGRFVDRSDVRFKVKVPKGLWGKLRLDALEAECVFRSGNFYIERSKAQTKHGILSVECDLKGGKEPDMLLTAYINMTNQPLKELLYSLGFETSYVEGRLTGEGIFFMNGRKKEELISSMTGQANILLENGTIIKSGVFIKVLDFLSIQKIFKRKPAELSKKGFYYESIKGYITIHKGMLETDSLIMRSPVLNGVAQGTIDFAGKRVDYDLGIQPLGTVDWMVSKIPVIGYIFTGKKKTVLIYHFKVKGPLSKPDVRYVPLKNLGGSVIGFFKRLFLTPVRLFKKIPRPSGELGPSPEKKL
ncbi:MAG: AsmA-like C-terminal domain-containing protein [Deltaproteobacteria bacterium]|nr:AsmA-like C-terminal domain-containing protein [Deltaproteobacteria bacterium]